MRSASPNIVVEFGQGSPLRDISSWITSDINLPKEGIFQDAAGYSDSSPRNLAVGFVSTPDVTLEGFFEDDDDGPMDVFGVQSGPDTDAYTLKVTWTAGSPSSYTIFPCHIKTPFSPMGTVRGLTKFRVVLTQAGNVLNYRQGVLQA